MTQESEQRTLSRARVQYAGHLYMYIYYFAHLMFFEY
jgi:hypothetical protein